MSTIRKFQLSANIFWGFQVNIDILSLNNMNEVNTIAKNDLLKFLKNNNLLELYDKAKELEIHNHLVENITPKNFLEKTPIEVVTYLCDYHDLED